MMSQGAASRHLRPCTVACHTAQMEIIDLPSGSLNGDAYGSRDVAMCDLTGLGADTDARVHIAWCGPNGVLGRHRAARHQLFAVITGSGWVAGADGVRVPIASGQAALWSPGEMHESGSETEMAALIVARRRPFSL